MSASADMLLESISAIDRFPSLDKAKVVPVILELIERLERAEQAISTGNIELLSNVRQDLIKYTDTVATSLPDLQRNSAIAYSIRSEVNRLRESIIALSIEMHWREDAYASYRVYKKSKLTQIRRLNEQLRAITNTKSIIPQYNHSHASEILKLSGRIALRMFRYIIDNLPKEAPPDPGGDRFPDDDRDTA